jgi:hypothetical protein
VHPWCFFVHELLKQVANKVVASSNEAQGGTTSGFEVRLPYCHKKTFRRQDDPEGASAPKYGTLFQGVYSLKLS